MFRRARLLPQHLSNPQPSSHFISTTKFRSFNAHAAKMSTFTLPSNNSSSSRSTPTTVSIPAELTQQQLLSFPAFNNWLETLQHNLSLQGSNKQHEFYDAPYELKSITVQAVDWFGHGRMGFLKMTAEIKNAKGERLPGSVFLRGGSVGMLVGFE